MILMIKVALYMYTFSDKFNVQIIMLVCIA